MKHLKLSFLYCCSCCPYHNIALEKLSKHEVTGILLLWFQTYLTGRGPVIVIEDRKRPKFSFTLEIRKLVDWDCNFLYLFQQCA